MQTITQEYFPFYVSGWLAEIPLLKMDSKGELFAVIKLELMNSSNIEISILIMDEYALKVRRYGFVGLALLIKYQCMAGVLLGKELIFIDTFTPNTQLKVAVATSSKFNKKLIENRLH